MVHISNKTLTSKKLGELFNQLNATLGGLSTKQSEIFLSEFLGKEEQIMLAKRLAAIIMIHNGQSIYKVAKVLKISTSTASDLRTRIQLGRYNRLLTVLRKDKFEYIKLLEAVDSILHLGGILPHYGETHRSEAFKRSVKSFD
jgi:uncharacterized protein YerC